MRPGEEKLKRAIARHRQARTEDPSPYDDNWGWWIEKRLQSLENGQRWLIRIAASILLAELLRLAAAAL